MPGKHFPRLIHFGQRGFSFPEDFLSPLHTGQSALAGIHFLAILRNHSTLFLEVEEMTLRVVGVAFVLTALLTTGCGTMANVAMVHPDAGGKRPFGGVHHDLNHIRSPQSCQNGACAAPHGQTSGTARTLLYTADLPLSFVGDVLTWPYTAAFTWINEPVPVPMPMNSPQQSIPQTPALGQPTTPIETLPAPRNQGMSNAGNNFGKYAP